jgi:hypothetical protein
MAIKDFDYTRKNPLDYDIVKQAEETKNALGEYQSSQAALDALNRKKELEANPIAQWTGGKWGQALEDQMNKINNREAFSYDLNGDALYQQYKDKYINQGRMAMQDTIGQASAMTGGYGNSYAATAGNQAYQAQLQNLNDIVPQLYQMAYDQYNQQGQDMKDAYSMLNNAYQTEYGEHRDTLSDHNTALDRATNEYYQAENLGFNQWATKADLYQNAYNAALNFAANESNTDYSNAFTKYQQGEQERQFDESQKASSGGGSSKSPLSVDDYHTIMYEAQGLAGDNNALDKYLNQLVTAEIITNEERDSIYAAYRVENKSKTKPDPQSLHERQWHSDI